MLAPCITVLSTSKNAAAVGSAGVSSARLDLGGGGRRLARQRRPLRRFSGLRGRSGGAFTRSAYELRGCRHVERRAAA